MKLLLVATNREQSPYPVAPLGALCVAAATKDAGHEVKFLDLGMAPAPQSALQQALEAGEFQAVAFSIRNLDNCWAFAPRSYFNDVQELAGIARQHFKGPLILGGSGFSVAPSGWMRRLDANYGVIGEIERTFPELLARLEAGHSPEGIEGVVTARNKSDLPAVLPAKPVERLVELPLPAHDLCGYRGYVKRGGFVSVQTKRGCPFKCSYCIYPQLEGRRYRLRPPALVAEEIETVARRSRLREFFFVDSVFNDPRKHALAICAELTRRKLLIRWNAFCNPVGFDAELSRAMAQAGCSGVEFGLDVATPKMLKALDKPFDQDEIRIALQAAHDARLPIAIYLLFGAPGETWSDVEDTQAFLNNCAPANAVFATYGLRIYEGTPLAKTSVNEGHLSPDHDLFEPAYYLSPGLADDIENKIDRIARRRVEWSSAVDWRRPVTRWGQKVTVLLNVRPQWKYMRGYGILMRRKSK